MLQRVRPVILTAFLVNLIALAAAQIVNKPALTLLGCFSDHGDRDLQIHARGGGMSLDKCLEACRCRGFAYMGIQNGHDCWCGNSYGRHGSQPAWQCGSKCGEEEASVACGGDWRNSIYTTGVTHATPGLKYIGCYEDRGDRDLSLLGGTEAMSLPKCYETCKSRGFAYFGVQDHNYCFCGNSYGKYGERPISECNRRCTGQTAEFCGGGGRNSVYATGLAPPK